MDASLEVEQKYRVENFVSIESSLKILACEPMVAESQCDIYLRHPSRDFGITGEAFRVRETNGISLVTYKGVKEPGAVKIREELEIPLAEGTKEQWLTVLERLGFQRVAEVRKARRSTRIEINGIMITVSLDSVEQLGCFVELEAIVNDRTTLEATQSTIQQLADKLQVHRIEPRSYLRQLLEQAV